MGSHSGSGRTHRSSGWHWLPWSGSDSSEPSVNDPVHPKASELGRYEGKTIPVEIKVVDDEGRPVPYANVVARVYRYDYQVAVASSRPSDAKDHGEASGYEGSTAYGWEGSTDYGQYLELDTFHAGRDGVVPANIVPSTATFFQATDRDGRSGSSKMVRLTRNEDGTIYSDRDQWPNNAGKSTHSSTYEVTVEISDPGAIIGSVVDERGRPIAAAEIVATAYAGDESSYVEHADELSGNAGVPPMTDASGVFHMPIRRAGLFSIEIHAPHFKSHTEPAVQVIPGHDTKLSITMSGSVEIKGKLIGPTGEPVEGASISVINPRTQAVEGSGYVPPGMEGAFAVEEVLPGTYTVQVNAYGFPPVKMENVVAGGAPVTIALRAGGHVTGDVTLSQELLNPGIAGQYKWNEGKANNAPNEDEDDRSIRGEAFIYLVGDSDPALGGTQSRVVTVDERGRGNFDFAGLVPGAYRVFAASLDNRSWSAGPSINVYEGQEMKISLRLPDSSSSGSLLGRVSVDDGTAIAGGEVILRAGSLPSAIVANVSPDGSYRFDSIPSGEYAVVATITTTGVDGGYGYSTGPESNVTIGRRAQSMDFVVPGSRTVAMQTAASEGLTTEPAVATLESPYFPEVELLPTEEGLVVTRAPSGPHASRLFAGDRVTSIDGERLDPAEPYSLLEKLGGAQGSMCRITADRPASREQVTVSLPRTRSEMENQRREMIVD